MTRSRSPVLKEAVKEDPAQTPNARGLRLCIPIEDRPLGGLYSFLTNFRRYLDAHGIPWSENPQEMHDVFFANSWAVPPPLVRETKLRLPDVRIVHRVDGAARDYGRTDGSDALQARVNILADLTIFQSRYSRHATTEKFKVISSDGPVIHNPVDVDHFSPNGDRITLPGRVKIACVTFSANPMKGTASVFRVAETNPDIDFFLIGRYDDAPLRPNLHTLGYLDRDTLPTALRACDLFLTFSENEACPNTVLEALATGLPVLYEDSGGTPELVGDCGVAVEPETFRSRLDDILQRRAAISWAARERAVSHFSPDVIFPQYLAAIASARRKPIPGLFERCRLRIRGYPVAPLPFASSIPF